MFKKVTPFLQKCILTFFFNSSSIWAISKALKLTVHANIPINGFTRSLKLKSHRRQFLRQKTPRLRPYRRIGLRSGKLAGCTVLHNGVILTIQPTTSHDTQPFAVLKILISLSRPSW